MVLHELDLGEMVMVMIHMIVAVRSTPCWMTTLSRKQCPGKHDG